MELYSNWQICIKNENGFSRKMHIKCNNDNKVHMKNAK